MRYPLSTAIGFALVSATIFFLIQAAVSPLLGRTLAYSLALGAVLAAWAVFTARGSGTDIPGALFPVSLIGLTGAWAPSMSWCWILWAGGIAWVRYGSAGHSRLPKLLLLVVLASVSTTLVFALHPQTPLSWTLAVWLHLLVQAAYDVIYPKMAAGQGARSSPHPDRFERARRRAEAILAGNAL
jgi:hypothetical protein